MKKVVSVRLREEVVAKIDEYVNKKKQDFPSRTDFLRKALEFYMKKKLETAKGVL